MKFHKLLTFITVLLFPMLSLAEKQGFIIKAIEKTPKFIINKQIIQTKYMVLNNTSSPLIHNRLIPFSSGIQQITTGKGTCQSTFDLEPGASCTLILEINAATMKNNTIQGGPKFVKHLLSQLIALSSLPKMRFLLEEMRILMPS